MQRYFVEPQQWVDDTIMMDGQDAHHVQRVMRMKVDDRVICSDAQTREAVAQITEFQQQQVTLQVVEWLPMDREPRVHVWVAQALPKGDKLELVWQKCTELGATRLIPFVSERTIVQYDGKKEAKRVERWQKIVKEAAEQAHRNRIPSVETPYTWREVTELAKQVDLALFCYEKEQVHTLRQALKNGSQTLNKLLIVIGPEGGFSEREVTAAETAGMRPISLGKRILRTETAALVALSCILYECDENGGS